eukprot:730280-Prorocentrum_minimum.AAC.1
MSPLLDLSFTGVTDAGLMALAPLAALTSLVFVSNEGTDAGGGGALARRTPGAARRGERAAAPGDKKGVRRGSGGGSEGERQCGRACVSEDSKPSSDALKRSARSVEEKYRIASVSSVPARERAPLNT